MTSEVSKGFPNREIFTKNTHIDANESNLCWQTGVTLYRVLPAIVAGTVTSLFWYRLLDLKTLAGEQNYIDKNVRSKPIVPKFDWGFATPRSWKITHIRRQSLFHVGKSILVSSLLLSFISQDGGHLKLLSLSWPFLGSSSTVRQKNQQNLLYGEMFSLWNLDSFWITCPKIS